MASLRELIIKISANSSSFQSEISRASRMGVDYYKTMEQGGRRASAATRQQQQALRDLNAEFASVKAVAAGMTGAVAGAFAVSSLIQTADNWGQLASRIKMATDSADQYNMVQSRLMEISDRTYKPIEEQAELFIRSSTAMKELGYSTESTIDFIDSISSLLTINAASADKGASAINALSKSMVLGKVSGGEWQTVMEVMPTVIGDVARYLGVTETAVKKLASEGKLSMQTFSDAIIRAKDRNGELADSMPNTVADAMTKLSNHWKKYLGEANEATGATQVFVSGLNSVSNNLGTLTDAGTAFVGVGVARYLGNMARSAGSATAALIGAKKEQIAFAAAQKEAATVAKAAAQAEVYQAQQALVTAKTTEVKEAQQARLTAAQTAYTASQERLRVVLSSGTTAEVTRARAAVSRAQAAVVAAKNADAQALAEKRLAAAQAKVGNTRAAQSTANANLNSATSVIGMAGRGAAGLLSLIGGIPGLLMVGAGAWYYMNQQTEQARKTAQDYGQQIGEVTGKLQAMSAAELSDTAGKTKSSLEEQNRIVSEQAEKVRKLEVSIKGYQQMLANPGPTIGGVMINHLTSVEAATDGLAEATNELFVEKVRLSDAEAKQRELLDALTQANDTLEKRMRDRAAEDNKAYQSLIRMNGAQSLFNQLIGAGNGLLSERAGLANVPMRLPQATVSDADQMKLIQKQRAAQLAGLDGEARVKLQVKFDLEDMGRTGLDNTKYAEQYEAAALKEFRANESRSASQKAASAAASALKSEQAAGARVAEQYASKMDDLSIAIEVQKVRAEQGQKAADLFAASHESGTKWTNEQRKAIEASAVELAKWSQKADEATRKQREMEDALTGLRDAARKYADEAQAYDLTRGMSSRQRSRFDDEQQVERVFDKTDKGVEAIAARNQALAALDNKYKQIAASEADWLSGASSGFKSWVDEATDYSGQMANAAHSMMGTLSDSMVDMLNGNKNAWKDWGVSVIQTIEKVMMNMLIANAASSIGSLFSFGAGGGGTAPSGFYNSASAGLTFNAKGGVYASSDLSTYSGQIVSSPTMFAFAKGAGIMGEAGPEAIMPLTRSADGSLGVRAIGGGGSSGADINLGGITVNVNSQGQASATGVDGAGIGKQIQQAVINMINEQANQQGTPLWRAINRRQ